MTALNQALEVLVSGQPRLLRVEAGATGTTAEEGVVTMRNPCVSGGTVEIFLEPRRPPSRLVVVGTTPVAQALVDSGTLAKAVESTTRLNDALAALHFTVVVN